jgi:hypothetical protein
MLNRKLLAYLNPGADVDEMFENDSRQQEYLMKQWRRQPWLAAPKAKSTVKSSRKR